MSTVALSVVNHITATANQTAVGGTTQDPIIAIANNPILPGTGSFVVPVGTTGQRLLQGAGSMRFNTTTGFFEASTDGATWVNLAVGGGGIASVTGTALQIDCTAGPNVVVSIDPGYVGQASITTLGTITTGTWHGTAIDETHGGTNQTSYILGDTLYASGANTLAKLAGNITNVKQYLSQTGTGAVSAAPAWATISGGDITGAALTAGNDTNVTLTTGGTPATALLRAASITAGWAGQLSLARGGTNAALVADNGAIPYSTAGAIALLASTATANQIILSGSHAAPSWSTATYPATTTINQILYSNAANTITGLATANRAVLTTSAAGVPVLTALATDGQLIVGSTAGAPAAATLTAGSGVTIVNGSNTITISATGSGGTVTSVTASSPLASSGGNTPDISLTGIVSLAHGGSNADLSAAVSNGGIVWTNATQMQVLAGTATASKMLLSGSTATPSWSTSTIPTSAGATANKVLLSDGTNYVLSTPTFPNASATAGKFIRSDGTNWIASTPTLPTAAGSAGTILRSDGTNFLSSTSTFADTYTASNLLYSNGANTVTGLATANSASLVTSATGVPVWSGTMTNGQVIIGSTGATPTAATITAGAGITVTNGAGSITVAATAVTANQTYPVLGRLTLQTNTPVTTGDVTAATTLYFTPYKGDEIALFDGVSTWNVIQFTQLSIAVPATTSTMYDVFIFNNSGTATLELVAWTNDTSRATVLVFQNGVYVKSGATTRRYIGSMRTTTVSGQTEDSLAKRYVWNYYNRVEKYMYVFESTASWTYTTAAFRQANGSTANQLDCVIGVSEDIVTVHATNNARNGTTATLFASGIGLDSTTVDSATTNSIMEEYIGSDDAPVHSDYRGYPGIGRHYFAWLEYSGAAGTTTWFGNQSIYKTGIHGNLFC